MDLGSDILRRRQKARDIRLLGASEIGSERYDEDVYADRDINFLNADPMYFGTTKESRKVNSWLKDYQNVKDTLTKALPGDGKQLDGLIDYRVRFEDIRDDLEHDKGLYEKERLKQFVVGSMFDREDPDDKVKKWDQKHQVYEWNKYKELFPEFISDSEMRAKLVIDLNVMFALMCLNQRPTTREEFLLLYLYQTDEDVRKLLSYDIVEEFMNMYHKAPADDKYKPGRDELQKTPLPEEKGYDGFDYKNLRYRSKNDTNNRQLFSQLVSSNKRNTTDARFETRGQGTGEVSGVVFDGKKGIRMYGRPLKDGLRDLTGGKAKMKRMM